MRDYSVPVTTYLVDLDYAGETLAGRVFLPVHSDRREGECRLDDWLNGARSFFPFLPEGERETLLLNKDWVDVMTLEWEEGALPLPEPPGEPLEVVVECGGARLEGHVHVDQPPPRQRLLDHLNRPEPFLSLWDEGRLRIIHKRRITRCWEAGSAA